MLDWLPQNTIVFDSTMVFGKGYDFFGLENLRREAFHGDRGFLIWPEDTNVWRLYDTMDGGLASVTTEQEAKALAESWIAETLCTAHDYTGHRNPGTPDGPGEYVEYCRVSGAENLDE